MKNAACHSLARIAATCVLAVCCALTVACSSSENSNDGRQPAAIRINGAGATFPYPLYSKWFDEYHQRNPAAEINYQSIGSGGGIRQVVAQTVFFGATDGPMSDEQLAAAPSKLLHVPMALGADVPAYNVPGLGHSLRFSAAVLSGIFLGHITKWNDARILADNPGTGIPPLDVTVVHRSDGSGTTYVWTDYLAKVSPEWKSSVGVSTSVRWPVGVGAKGNEGVAGLIRQTPGAIGYVELVYALQNQMTYGAVRNRQGEFVTASPASVTAAAAAEADRMPDDFRVSITDAAGDGAYPISSFTWLLIFEDPKEKPQARVMVDFIKWALTEGQQLATPLGYAPLPPAIAQRTLTAVARVRTE